ncbi:MAG: hypothetical protein ACSLE5_03880 [Porticoccaceae bacterium]
MAEFTENSAARFSEKDRETFHNQVTNGVLRNRPDHDGAIKCLDAFRDSGGEYATRLPGNLGNVRCAGVRVEDTLFKSLCKENPSSTLLRLTEVRGDGGVRESHVLMSEAWWTDETVYPTISELRNWVWVALPVALRMHLIFLITSSWDEFYGWREVESPVLVLMRVLRIPIDIVIATVKIALLMPLMFIFAVFAQSALALFSVLSLVPIKWVQSAVGWTIDLLMVTIGQSYALKTSAVRCNAIVRDVMKDLEWMEPRCRRIVVVSHSQGAEIARQVFRMRRWPKVKRWVTAGSGILPLAALEKEQLYSRAALEGVYKIFYTEPSLSQARLAWLSKEVPARFRLSTWRCSWRLSSRMPPQHSMR